MKFSRGMRDKLGKYVDIDSPISIEMRIEGAAAYDCCCFGVDGAGKLSDDRYMVFYNQTSSPAGEITLAAAGNPAVFRVELGRLPAAINKLVFTASIDGNGTMGEISRFSLSLSQNGREAIAMELPGSDFQAERAVIAIELYRRDEWRAAAVASGFNGGLSALLRSFGGEEASPAPPPVPAAPERGAGGEQLAEKIMGKISLSKDKVNLEKHVVNLSKCVVDLSKKGGIDLGSVRAKVAVVLDYSGSMRRLYKDGTVQRTVNRLVPLGLTFDDNGSIDVYLFQNDYRRLPDLTLRNYEDYVKSVIDRSGYSMGGTYYAPVLQAILDGSAGERRGFLGLGKKAAAHEEEPTFVLFITDGSNADKSATNKVIVKSSSMNIFIQFIGIGAEQFKYLMRLDSLPGRERDNTGFSRMDSLDGATDEELYTNVLQQFSAWLKGLQ